MLLAIIMVGCPALVPTEDPIAAYLVGGAAKDMDGAPADMLMVADGIALVATEVCPVLIEAAPFAGRLPVFTFAHGAETCPVALDWMVIGLA